LSPSSSGVAAVKYATLAKKYKTPTIPRPRRPLICRVRTGSLTSFKT
jgi:hypothetical protein